MCYFLVYYVLDFYLSDTLGFFYNQLRDILRHQGHLVKIIENGIKKGKQQPSVRYIILLTLPKVGLRRVKAIHELFTGKANLLQTYSSILKSGTRTLHPYKPVA